MFRRYSEGEAIRCAGAGQLCEALHASRRDTLARFADFERALDELVVPQQPELNPPLWELGHIGWFQEFWIARNPQRDRGTRADPAAPRPAGVRAGADGLYDSSRVAHDERWRLDLPGPDATREDLAAQLETTQRLLREAGDHDDALYFFRLALLHEDMHHEAALYTSHALGIGGDDARWQAAPLPDANAAIDLEAGTWRLGFDAEGFAFDNELAPHPIALPAARIDSRVLRWAEYLPFVEAGGYTDERWWSPAGLHWLAQRKASAPRSLRRSLDGWLRRTGREWVPLELALPACHLSLHEADAWCRWAGRRLPTEGEWERAAIEAPESFRWGEVWEWTASGFAPYPGFVAHPYRDYSSPWFDGRPVLRGASFATQPRLRHARYRNYFLADRNDIFAGFRTCAD